MRRTTIVVSSSDQELRSEYNDSDMNEQEQLLQRTIMKNLISGGFRSLKIRRSTSKFRNHCLIFDYVISDQ